MGSLAACATTKPQSATKISASKPIHVVTSLDFYGEVAKAVLGDHGTVTTIIKSASIDPHDFEPTPKDAALVSHANFVLANGIGYDAWMQKLVKSDASKQTTSIRVGEDVMGKKTGDNEHIWYDPETMSRVATTLAQKFSQQAPKYKQTYHRNAAAYIKSLAPLQNQLKELKQNSNQRAVDVSEPVFDYALTALGYRRNNTSFEMAIENGTDPSPKSITAMQRDIKKHRIAFFVNNSQASSKTVATMVKLAKKHHVPVLNVTETLPAGKTYRTWMIGQYHQLAKIQNSPTH
ncbi:metal ABC transporter solute-binding protein [Levilactobacillus fujinensis]|uniref:Metal ABC transporter solute-binding protein n=1 Tax=Levilactobacillus fujinensis TaxID=2486024 RepID=A0ABW1TKA7_9LACO|nr:metal ABC transporter solute-binding protein [Levilactobacillus fujinensis]